MSRRTEELVAKVYLIAVVVYVVTQILPGFIAALLGGR